MKNLKEIEGNRLALQKERDSKKTQLERNKLGQYATPSILALDILNFSKTLIPEKSSIRFLDPAFGTGSFYSALLNTYDPSVIETAHGYEIDRHYADPTVDLWKDTPLEINIQDFTKAKPPIKKYNLLICNPPYVRHHHLSKEQKDYLVQQSFITSGHKISALAGLYCHFLLQSHMWVEDEGIAGWLIPTEFMDVNYGTAIKDYLLDEVELLRIHRFEADDLQFADALVSSALVWFRKRKPKSNHKVEFSHGGSLASPLITTYIKTEDLRNKKKWSKSSIHNPIESSEDTKIKDYFTIKRGLATGNNKFFILSEEEIKRRELPREFFRPILPPPRNLQTDEILVDNNGEPLLEKKLFLIDSKLSEEEIEEKHPKMWEYLKTGKNDTATSYLCSRRTPWYSQEKRPPAPVICTYMSRQAEKPFRFILNPSKATAANTYLLLYPKGDLLEICEVPGVMRKVWQYLNTISADSLLREGRTYGGGLNKMEPKELAEVPAEGIREVIAKYREI